MSDYSDEDFEMSGSGTAAQFDYKPPASKPAQPETKPAAGLRGKANASPFQANNNRAKFSLDEDSDGDLNDGYAPGGQVSGSGDYEEDFDEDEEE